MNTLRGRMLRVESSKRKEILLVYDPAMDLEQILPLATRLSKLGAVTCMDLPGSGGMDSFYTIKSRPGLRQYSEYIASCIKLRYKGKKISMVAIGSGGTLTVRMLQQHTTIASKVSGLVIIDTILDSSDVSLKSSIVRKVFLHILLFRPMSFICGLFSKLSSKQDFRTRLRLELEIASVKVLDTRLLIRTHAVLVSNKAFDLKVWKEHLKIVFKNVSSSVVRKKMSVISPSIIDELPAAALKILS